jgi:hypothetical protein
MKLADIQPGVEYGLRQKWDDPRRVEALGIVTVEERVWDRALERFKPRSVKRVQIKFLDSAKQHYDHAKGAKTNVPATHLVAPWNQIGLNIRKKHEDAILREELSAQLEKRLKKLLGRNYNGYVSVGDARNPHLSLSGTAVAKILDLAEKGKG